MTNSDKTREIGRHLKDGGRLEESITDADIRLARAMVADAERRDRRIGESIRRVAARPLQEDLAAG